MAITEKQRELRRKHLGSSDMAAVLGIDQYRTAYDVWAEKTGRDDGPAESQAMQAGTRFESGVLDFAEEELGPILKNQYRSNPQLHLGANIDAIVRDTSEPVEGKTAGLFGPLTADWGEVPYDVPERVAVQCHVHMLCLNGANAEVCHVPAFLGGRGFQMFVVERNRELADLISEEAVRFWADHVLKDVPPEGVIGSLDCLKRLKRTPSEIVVLDHDLIDSWVKAKVRHKKAEEERKEIEAKILTALGDAEGGEYGDEATIVTYFAQNSSPKVNYAALKADGVFKEYCTQGQHRVLRIQKR